MQKDSKLFDDMARMMSGATNMAFDMKREMEGMVARQMEALLGKTSLVTREEFEAVKASALKAREENDALRLELNVLKEMMASGDKPASAKSPKKETVKPAS
jgi:BMFP domain-containing protein YqiC